MSRVGRFLRAIGWMGLAAGVGSALGFYAADRGTRWFPTMADLLLIVSAASLILIVISRIVDGSLLRRTEKGVRIRKSILFCIVLILAAAAIGLGTSWMRKPSPLTDLSAAEFDEAFETDIEQYFLYDKAIDELTAILQSNPDAFDPNTPRTLTPDEEKLIRDVWDTTYEYAFALDQIRLFYEDWFRFDPSRTQRSRHLRSFLLTFAAELTLYEKSTTLVQLITRNPNAVKFLNAPGPNPAIGAESFSRLRQQLQGTRDQARVVAGSNYLLWLERALRGRTEAAKLGCGNLWDKIETELALVDAVAPMELAGTTMRSDLSVLRVSVDRVWYPAQKGVAKWMGNTRLRRIGTYLITRQQQTELAAAMEPGDVMLSRKNWHLSNVGLPGFWPHAILYIGSPDKLQAYFDCPEVTEHISDLAGEQMTLDQYLAKKHPMRWQRYTKGLQKQQYHVIEGIKPGIVLNTMSGCCGDYMAVIRPRLDKIAKAQAIIEAFGHLDKPYDFNFDFATDHALVCTELVYRSYRPAEGKLGMEFDLVNIAGRLTLPANEIARIFATEHGSNNARFDFVYFIDAIEKTRETFVSTEEEFLKSHQRIKWDIALD